MPEVTSSPFNPDDFKQLLTPKSEPEATPVPSFSNSGPVPIAEDMETPVATDESVNEPHLAGASVPNVTLAEGELPYEPDESDETLAALSQLSPEQIQALVLLAQGKSTPDSEVGDISASKTPDLPDISQAPEVESFDEFDVTDDDLIPYVEPKRGWRKLAARFGIPVGPSQDDIEDNTWSEVISRTFPHTVVIGNTSLKGGCGKTTSVITQAAVVKMIKPEASVIVVDMDPTGNVINRAKSEQVTDIQTYVEAVKQGMTDPSAYVVPTYGGVDILGSRMDITKSSLNPQEAVAVLEAVSRHYDYVFVDMPYFTDRDLAYSYMLSMLDVVVFLFEAKDDALETLDYMTAVLQSTNNEYLIPRRVVAFNHTKPKQNESFDPSDYIEDLLEREEIEVVELPYDDHLYWSDALEIDRIKPSKFRQFVQLTAAAIYSVESPPRAKPSILPPT